MVLEVQMLKVNLISKLSIISIAMFSLASCSNGNVKGDWDCPKQNGLGCVKIEDADSVARSKLSMLATTTEKEIWIAPFIDKQGKSHPARIVRY